MEEVLIALLYTGGSTMVVIAIVVSVLVKNPEKVEKWAAILNKILSGVGGVFRSAHKRYVKHDLQSRINSFIKNETKTAPFLEDTRVVVEWVDSNQDKKGFLENGNVILRLRREDPEDLNFVHGTYWSVATRLIPKVKRYVSPSQRQALDLYVTASIIEKEKYQVIEYFLEHYLHPYMEDTNSKISKLYHQFDKIDKYGVFYPILLQELYFLSMKVYGSPKDDNIIVEVTRLVDFLERVATRKIGEEIKLDFTGTYCRFAIVIIGKAHRISLEGTDPYIDYIKGKVLPQKVETIYLLGKYEYHEFIDEVCDYLDVKCERYATYRYTGELSANGEVYKEEEYLVVLRTSDVTVYQG